MLQLVFPLDLAIFAGGIVGLIPQVPTQNAVIVAELGQHSRDIVVQTATVAGVVEVFSARALHPAGVVDPRFRRALRARSGERIPTRVEEDEEWFDAVARRDADKLRETAVGSLGDPGPRADRGERPA